MKQAGSMFLLTTASFIANFVVFIYAYRFLALPPNLLETQRIENAPLIFFLRVRRIFRLRDPSAMFARILYKRQ